MPSNPLNRTYARQNTQTSRKTGRKPLSTFNSAPALTGSHVTRKASSVIDDDSLDDFVVSKKPVKAAEAKVIAKSTTKKIEKKAPPPRHSAKSPSLFSEDDDDDDNDTFSPTPIFRHGGGNVMELVSGASATQASKDDKFDKLFAAGPIRNASVRKNSNPSPCWGSSSKEYFSSESSIEKENSGGLLFASFSERLDLLCQDKGRKTRKDYYSEEAGEHNDDGEKKTRKKKERSETLKPRRSPVPTEADMEAVVAAVEQKINDRPFSEDTLNYVAEGIEAIAITEAEESDVFASPLPPLASRKDKFSPAIGQQATSTPNVVKARLSRAESLQSPLNAHRRASPGPMELIHRKGGKGWRRSSSVALALPVLNGVAAGATTPSVTAKTPCRRATIMIDSSRRKLLAPPTTPLGRICSQQQQQQQRRQTTACFLQQNGDLMRKGFDEREEEDEAEEEAAATAIEDRSCRSMHSSFHILPSPSSSASQNTQKFDESPLWTKSSLSDIDKVLSRCTHSQIRPFQNLYTPQRLAKARKVGEGAFGEVFLLPYIEEEGKDEKEVVVVKIVPVDGDALVNGQPQMKLIDMLAEIIISTELSKLSSSTSDHQSEVKAPGFLTVLSCDLTEGKYPDTLLDKWDDYHRDRVSENDRPDGDLLGTEQKFVVLELKHGGQDLESVTLNNAAQGWAIFQQVAHALAMAEKTLQFEHRDLHWGNILIKDCKEKTLSFASGHDSFTVETCGVRATIIDFSLSRLTLPKEGCDIFNNLSEDQDLFASEGDYQFEVYRMMREHTADEWRNFHPRTNVMWLHYLLDKLTSEVFYKNKKSKAHRSSMAKMRQMRDTFLDEAYGSAYDYVSSSSQDSTVD